jgi:serine/threonine protein phosphatase 1
MRDWPLPKPNVLTYVVGDLHGCTSHLSRLFEQIEQDADVIGSSEVDLVFVGDYIDRGAKSALALDFLHRLTTSHSDRVTCLLGNHEQMLLAFLDDPLGRPKRWLHHGGIQTIASYGITPPASFERATAPELLDISGDLREAMGNDLVMWLENLPLRWNSGNLWVVHAGADPQLPMELQDPMTLVWGHERFFAVERSDAQWVTVGHQPVEEPFAAQGRIAIDTGAVYGGPLTALRVTPDGDIAFIQSRPKAPRASKLS